MGYVPPTNLGLRRCLLGGRPLGGLDPLELFPDCCVSGPVLVRRMAMCKRLGAFGSVIHYKKILQTESEIEFGIRIIYFANTTITNPSV